MGQVVAQGLAQFLARFVEVELHCSLRAFKDFGDLANAAILDFEQNKGSPLARRQVRDGRIHLCHHLGPLGDGRRRVARVRIAEHPLVGVLDTLLKRLERHEPGSGLDCAALIDSHSHEPPGKSLEVSKAWEVPVEANKALLKRFICGVVVTKKRKQKAVEIGLHGMAQALKSRNIASAARFQEGDIHSFKSHGFRS